MVGGDFKVLTNMRVTVQYCGKVYKTVAQSVLLYISESWLVMGTMLKVLEGLHYRVDIKIMAMTEKHMVDGEW